MTTKEFLDRLRQDRTAGKHVLGGPLEASIGRPAFIPHDMFEFYERANGIRFWIDADDAGFFSLLPIEQIGTPVRQSMLGDGASDDARRTWPDQIIALSTHLDAKYFLALDTRNGRYLEADPLMRPRTIGRSWSDVLDWMWAHWIEAMREDEAK